MLGEIAGLVLVWLAAFSCRTTIVSIGALLPVFLKQLGLSGFWGGTLTALPLLIIAAISMPSGWIADRVGQRPALAGALGVLAIGCVVPTIVGPTKAAVFLNVTLSGLGVGLAQPTLAKVARVMNPQNPTLPTTLYATGLVTGGLGASLLSIPLFDHLDHRWPWVFLAWGLLIGTTGIGWLLLKTRLEDRPNDAKLKPFAAPRPRFLYAIAGSFAAQGAVFYALITWLPEYYVHLGWPLEHASILVACLSLGSIMGGLASPWVLRIGRGFRSPFLGVSALIADAVVGLATLPMFAFFWAWLAGSSTAVVFTLGLAAPSVLSESHAVGRDAGRLLTIGFVGAVAGPLGFGSLFGTSTLGAMLLIALIGLTVGIAALVLPPRLGDPAAIHSTANS